MATYGNGVTPGAVPFTGWTWTLVPGLSGSVGGATGNVRFNGLTQDDLRISSMLNRQPNRAVRMLLRTLIGAAAGSSASSAFKRVLGVSALSNAMMLGGLVTIESGFYVNRNTAAADATALIAMLDRTHGPATYAPDVSGNGGGGKAGW